MKIRTKVFFITVGGILALVLLAFFIIKVLVVDSIQKEETTIAFQSYGSVQQILHTEGEVLSSVAMDWAVWDDTYKFITTKNKKFIDDNLNDVSIQALKVNFMVFLNDAGNPVYTKTYELEPGLQDDFTTQLLQQINIEKEKKNLKTIDNPLAGLVVVNGKPFFVAVTPVSSSDGKAKTNGYFLVGKNVTQDFLQYVGKVTNTTITTNIGKTTGIFDRLGQDYSQTTLEGSSLWIKKSKDTVEVYSPLADIHGEKDVFIVFNMERKMYQENLQAISMFLALFFTGSIIISIICLLIVNKSIVKRLAQLHSFIETVGKQKNTMKRIYLPGLDEISDLALMTNQMLEQLDKAHRVSKNNEERYRKIMEATNEGYFDYNLLMDRLYVSSKWLEFMGCDPKRGDIEYRQFLNIIMLEDRETFFNAFNDCISGKTESLMAEYRVVKKSGEWNWIISRGKVVEYDPLGKPIRFIGTISDITSQKKFEKQNMYLSQTDTVMELKNRAYIEPILNRADACPEWKCWIIMGDLNGLKLINDSYGHELGDQLLHTVGDILKTYCSEEDIPVRWGGDEFIIFIKDETSEYVENLINNIKKGCSWNRDYPFQISIALGTAERKDEYKDMDSLIKLAEERMHRNKLLTSKSVRNSILASLEQSLHEKHIETVEHTQRIKNFSQQIGRKLGFKQDELDELSLLGALHDIGKIGIPESILLKPGKLSEDEWETMTKHVEIGYRIAISTPDLAHIADEVLSHHERIDGTGYPHGLKGDEIPKLSRLLAIVDSYDVMTHDRVYQKAMSKENAIEELIRCSGTQFDPEMVSSFIELLQD